MLQIQNNLKREPNFFQNIFTLTNQYIGGWSFLVKHLFSTFFRNKSYDIITMSMIENQFHFVLLGVIIVVITSWIQIVVMFKRSKSTGDGFKIIGNPSKPNPDIEYTSDSRRLFWVTLCVISIITYDIIFSYILFSTENPHPSYIQIITLAATVGWGFSNGKPYGVIDSWYLSGKLKSTSNYFGGLKHGYSVTYYENGNIEMCGEFSKGLETGKWEFYNEDGSLNETKFYEVTFPSTEDK